MRSGCTWDTNGVDGGKAYRERRVSVAFADVVIPHPSTILETFQTYEDLV